MPPLNEQDATTNPTFRVDNKIKQSLSLNEAYEKLLREKDGLSFHNEQLRAERDADRAAISDLKALVQSLQDQLISSEINKDKKRDEVKSQDNVLGLVMDKMKSKIEILEEEKQEMATRCEEQDTEIAFLKREKEEIELRCQAKDNVSEALAVPQSMRSLRNMSKNMNMSFRWQKKERKAPNVNDLESRLIRWQEKFDTLNQAYDEQMQECQVELEEACTSVRSMGNTSEEGAEKADAAREQLEKLVCTFNAFPTKARIEELEAEVEEYQRGRLIF